MSVSAEHSGNIGAGRLGRLVDYVAPVLGHAGPRRIVHQTVERSAWQDQGCEVRKDVFTFQFDNGAILRRTVEQDDFPDEQQVCAECWITYEVVRAGEGEDGMDAVRKTFDNACREAFWLAYHRDLGDR